MTNLATREERSGVNLKCVALSGLFALSHGFTLAGTGSCLGAGAISVNAPVVGECGLDSGDSLTVTSGGSITGDGSGASVGVRVSAGVTGVQITNEGNIQGDPSDGIWNQGSIDRITNRGQLQGGGAFTLGLYNVGTITEFNNEANGVISNSAGQPNAIESPGNLGTLNNAGRILGGISTNNTTINILGTSSRITGAVSNTDGSIRLPNGSAFTTENTFSSASFHILSGARLQIGASGHGISVSSGAGDAFNNEGTLDVPEGVQVNINGNYTQSGVLRLGASSDASFGRLNVVGDAILTPAAQFEVDVAASHTLAAGDTLSGVVTASGSLSNSAPTNNVSDNSALFNFESVTNDDAVDLQVVAAGSPAPAPSPNPSPAPAPAPEVTVLGSTQGIVPAVIQHGLFNGVPAARVLDGYIRGGATGTDFDNAVTALGKLPTNRSVAQAVGQLMPSLHGNAALAGLAHSASSKSVIEQQAESGQSGGSEAGGRGLWVRPIGNWVQQDAVDSVSGFKVASYGLMGGVQADPNARSTLGFGLGYLRSTVDGQDFAASHSTDMEGVQLVSYGHHTLNEAGWQLNWQGDYTRSRVESQRHLGFIGRTAEGKYDADAWHVGLGISRAVAMSPGITFKPMVALDWRRFNSDAYSETGAGALSLQTESQKAEEAILKFGAQVQGDLGSQTQWLARAALGYDLSKQRNAVTARFTGGGAAFTIEGLPHSRTVAELGVGLRYRPTEGMEVIARYDLALRKGLRDQSATVRVGWSF